MYFFKMCKTIKEEEEIVINRLPNVSVTEMSISYFL